MIYFVATPIGNLEDITIRALNTLKNADVIACEDTRTSQKLLSRYEISKKLISFHKFNEKATCEKIIQLDEDGKNVAIISDAGMPVISDPGNILTKELNERNIKYTVIPGANAGLCALLLSGLDATSFYFVGFLSDKKSEKISTLKELSLIKSTLIFYVSPHNLEKDINDICSVLGNRKVSLVKEITKLHETIYSFNLGDKISFAEESEGLYINPNGEFVLVVEGASQETDFANLNVPEHVKFYINLGMSKNDAIKRVANERNVKKDTIYKQVLSLK